MNIGVVLGVLMALAYAVMNGVNDAAAVVALPVVTRVVRPSAAIAIAVLGNLLGPLLLGTAVAGLIAGIVTVQGPEGVAVVGAGLTSAVAWCAFCWWRGIPASASQALVGGLTGAALAAGGPDAVKLTVESAMTPEPYIVTPDADLAEVAREMAARRCGSAIVVDQASVVGVFTTVDALLALARFTSRDDTK